VIIEIRHFGIVVENLQKSLDFYQNLLGFELVVTASENSAFIDKILGFDSSELKTCKLKGPDGIMIELLDFGKDNVSRKSSISSTGPTHLALTVNDVEEAFRYMTKQKIKFISPPQISPDGYAKVAFCKAPEGTYIEIVEVLIK
jgi:catechol 2,3-dioxygenase-like lactoylglutathione lyase family enzyme